MNRRSSISNTLPLKAFIKHSLAATIPGSWYLFVKNTYLQKFSMHPEHLLEAESIRKENIYIGKKLIYPYRKIIISNKEFIIPKTKEQILFKDPCLYEYLENGRKNFPENNDKYKPFYKYKKEGALDSHEYDEICIPPSAKIDDTRITAKIIPKGIYAVNGIIIRTIDENISELKRVLESRDFFQYLLDPKNRKKKDLLNDSFYYTENDILNFRVNLHKFNLKIV